MESDVATSLHVPVAMTASPTTASKRVRRRASNWEYSRLCIFAQLTGRGGARSRPERLLRADFLRHPAVPAAEALAARHAAGAAGGAGWRRLAGAPEERSHGCPLAPGSSSGDNGATTWG